MKVKSPSLLKKIIAALSSKTNELRIRFMIFFLLHKNMDKTSLTHSFSHKLQALVANNHPHKKKNDNVLEEEEEGESKTSLLMHYTQPTTTMVDQQHEICGPYTEESTLDGGDDVEDNKYPDLTHALFKESEAEMEAEEEAVEGGSGGSGAVGVVEEVVDVGEEDIDQAADLFIKRFKRQIQLQKQQSLERHHSLLQSNV